jgi:integrase
VTVTASQHRSTSSALVLLSDVHAEVAEAFEAELLEGTQQPTMGPDLIEAVLASFIDKEGKLVPARIADLGDIPADQRRTLERARLIDEMRAGAWADATLSNYGSSVRAWMAWCRDEDVPALPFAPEKVAHFLMDTAFVWDDEADDWLRDADGGLVPARSAMTVSGRLMALNRAAEFVGIPRPGDNTAVKEVIRGIRRRMGVAPEWAKAALDLKALTRCLAATTGLTYIAARDRAARLLRVRTEASAGQLASLAWSNVDLEDDEVTITLARTHRHGHPRVVTIVAHRNSELCLVRALRDLRAIAPKLREVLTHPDGKPMTRAAWHAALRDEWDELPTLDDRDLAARLAELAPATPVTTARDHALLLVGFYTALRRSNLSSLNWRDIKDHGGDGLSLRIRRSKTDTEGKGRTSWVPQAEPGSDLACPAEALRAWKAALEAALGRRVRDDEPVFVSVTKHGTVKLRDNIDRPLRLTGEGINEAVQRLAVAAGLTKKPAKGARNPYGAHSLRAGFVTEALRDDKLTVIEVMEVTDHKSAEMVSRYRREVNAPKRNAARKMMGRLVS